MDSPSDWHTAPLIVGRLTTLRDLATEAQGTMAAWRGRNGESLAVFSGPILKAFHGVC